jgi:orotate phosphoribosyltransferase
MNEDSLIFQLKKHHAIYEGHFLLSSGRHSNLYINKDAIYCSPYLFSFVINEFVEIMKDFGEDFGDIKYNIITGPAIAGAILAAPLAVRLNKIFIYPEKVAGSRFKGYPIKQIVKTDTMKFRRGYNKVLQDKKVVIIEDIITTGASVQKTIDAIRLCGGKCVAVLAIWNRTEWNPLKGIKIISLINRTVESWSSLDCPLCKRWVPLIDPKD